MKTALIILNYNAYVDILNLLNQLLFLIDKKKYVIIVLDNNSPLDRDKLDYYLHSKKAFFITQNPDLHQTSILKEESLIYIKLSENNGYSYGNNIGLKLSQKLGFDYAFIINPDISIPDIRIFDDSISIFEQNKKIGVLGYRVILPNGQNQGPFKYDLSWDISFRYFLFPLYDALKTLFWKIEKQVKGFITVPAIVGCFVGLDLNKLKEVNYYDENVFLYYEEYIISAKMRQCGYITAYRDKYYVCHNHNYGNDKKSIKEICNDEKSKSYYVRTYLNPSPLLTIFMKFSLLYYKVFIKQLIVVIKTVFFLK